MTILYVDDDADDRDIFREAIKSIDDNIVLISAENGLEALTVLDRTTALPDLIFLDINMPLMDGITCLKEIKLHRKTANIPVIMFTTTRNTREIDECKAHGASGFVNKPASYAHFAEMLDAVINSGDQLPVWQQQTGSGDGRHNL
jgi:CheY-like chemotaxis protein